MYNTIPTVMQKGKKVASKLSLGEMALIMAITGETRMGKNGRPYAYYHKTDDIFRYLRTGKWPAE